MTLLHSVILGIIEGVTEFLPISSTGHLILASRFLGLQMSDVLKSFEISIQAGAILAVVLLYWRRFFVEFGNLKKIIVAFIPTGIIGLLLYKIVKTFFLDSTSLVLWSLFIGGIIIILFEAWYREETHAVRNLNAVSYKQAFLIGVAQSVAIIPGVSRAAATIIGGLLLGLDRKTVVEFSFLLAVPTMFAATVYDISKNVHIFSSGNILLFGVGIFVSFITALFTVRFFLRYIQRHNFLAFGVYRIMLALMIWVLF